MPGFVLVFTSLNIFVAGPDPYRQRCHHITTQCSINFLFLNFKELILEFCASTVLFKIILTRLLRESL